MREDTPCDPYSSGMNLTEIAMEVALGKKPVNLIMNRVPLPWQPHSSVKDKIPPFQIYELKSLRYSAERAWLSIPGKVSKIYGLEEAKSLAFVRDVLPRVKEGGKVDFPRNNVEKCGNIIAVADSRALSYSAADNAVSSITLRLEKNNPDTEKFLSGVSEKDEEGFPPSAFTFAPAENVETRRPVGSQMIADGALQDVSSATIRNIMKELEEEGYLYQPHTSGGRIPTDKAYRYYVDYLASVQQMAARERQRIEEQYDARVSEVDNMLVQTSRLLAMLSGAAGFARCPTPVTWPKKPLKKERCMTTWVHW